MGFLIVPDITDEEVVCQDTCQHTDCAQTREEWRNAHCAICGQSMLAGQPFYTEGTGVAHAGCVCDRETIRRNGMGS